MFRVLIIKTSSLGDIVHTLPAITEAKKACPHIQFDWLVDESFQEIPMWHPAIYRVIPIPLRRWRKQWFKAWRQGELAPMLKKIREVSYDLIIDAQGLCKSTLLALVCRGKRVGLSFSSAREPVASVFYQQKITVPNYKKAHAIQRARILFAKIFGYAPPEKAFKNFKQNIDYGLGKMDLSASGLNIQKPYCVFLHGTTWASKFWPESYWIELTKALKALGFETYLPWGNALEYAAAERIKADAPYVHILPKSGLGELASILASATAVVSVDTGLGHLSAALGVPTIALFGSTDPRLTSPIGQHQETLSAVFPCAPCLSRTCTYKGEKTIDSPCYTTLSPTRVMQAVVKLLENKQEVV